MEVGLEFKKNGNWNYLFFIYIYYSFFLRNRMREEMKFAVKHSLVERKMADQNKSRETTYMNNLHMRWAYT